MILEPWIRGIRNRTQTTYSQDGESVPSRLRMLILLYADSDVRPER